MRTGDTFWNRTSITPVFDSLGQLVSYIHVHSDITELVRRKVRCARRERSVCLAAANAV